MFPIFIPIWLDDLPSLDFEGFGKFLLIILCWCFVTVPGTYFIVGHFNGYDAFGIYFISGFIGFISSLIPTLITSIILD